MSELSEMFNDFFRVKDWNHTVIAAQESSNALVLKTAEAITSTTVLVAEKPEAHPVVLDDGCDEEYLDLAQKIGFSCPEIEKQRLLNFLRQEGYPIYDYESVKRYMDDLMERLNREENRSGYHNVWYWCPLRGKDHPQSGQTQYFTSSSVGELGSGWFAQQQGLMNYAVAAPVVRNGYSQVIPKPVLRTVAEISAKLPDAQFFVSDYQCVKPDPFLAIRMPGMTDYIVLERWSEPGFREAK